jgi:site-specific recombinase XerD
MDCPHCQSSSTSERESRTVHDDRGHPHMLRHSTSFKLANDGQDTWAIRHYLGHRNIQHTVLDTHLAAERFNDFWDD